MGDPGQMLDAVLGQDLVGICVMGQDGDIRVANDRFLTITGYSREDIDAGRVPALGFEPGGATSEKDLLRKDGTRVHVRINAAPAGPDERVGFLLDVTAEQTLAERERERRETQRLAQLGTWRWDRASDTLVLSDELYRILGREPGEITLTTAGFLELVHPDDRERTRTAIARDVRGQGPVIEEFRTLRRDGSVRHLRSTSNAIFEGERFAGLTGIVQDVTERALAEEALRHSEQRLRTVVDGIAIGVTVCDRDLRIIMANPAAVGASGGDPALIIGRSALDASWNAVHDDGTPFPPEEQPIAVAMRTGRPVRDVILGAEASPGGERRWLLINAQPQLDAAGEVSLVVVSFMDITDRRALQARLALADRMVSVGTLAAGVAHEINNPLAYVIANLGFVAHELDRRGRDIPGAPSLAKAIADAREGAERVRNIVRDLRTFSRGDDDRRGPVDVKRVIDSAVTLVWNQIRHAGRLTVEIGALPLVYANESRLAQVFVNLLVNAAQAIGGGNAGANEIRVSGTAHDGRVVLEVADTGCGIPAEDLKRVFDPFFTTKPVGMGTGLGLSICQGIVAELGGEIAVESQLGKGSTFRVILPALDSVRIAGERAQPGGDAPRGRVLVIDDEPAIGNAIGRMLEDEHDVTIVSSGKQALELLATDARWDAVLCDLLMPHMTGMELFARLGAAYPRIAAKTIFLTGGAFTPQARAFLEKTPNRVLEKPFDFDRLRALVAVVVKGE